MVRSTFLGQLLVYFFFLSSTPSVHGHLYDRLTGEGRRQSIVRLRLPSLFTGTSSRSFMTIDRFTNIFKFMDVSFWGSSDDLVTSIP